MEWPIVLVMVIAAPLILLPVAFVWYLNVGGIVSAYKKREAKEVKETKTARAKVKAGG